MGARGPAPKPVELRLLEGNRGNRPIDLQGLFRPQVGAPDAPRWLTAEARKAWRRLVPELMHYNLLSRVDRDALALLCQTIGRCEQIERAIAGRQAAYEAEGKPAADALMGYTPNGMQVQAAIYTVLNREQAKLWQMLKSFGLRPDARTAVTAGIRAQLSLIDPEGKTEPQAKPADSDGLPQSFGDFT